MAVHRERASPLQSARGCMGKCRLSVDAKQWFRRRRKEGFMHDQAWGGWSVPSGGGVGPQRLSLPVSSSIGRLVHWHSSAPSRQDFRSSA
jgi:hypothetical protein